MKKTLICVDNLDEFICADSHSLHMDATRLLTPGAKDELSRRGIAIVYGPVDQAACTNELGKALASCPDMEHLVYGLAGMLKKECGITDPEELRTSSLKALQIIKDHI